MTDQAQGPHPEAPAREPRRVRRRRSSSRSRRSKRVQSRIPFTRLRFSRPRLPTVGQALGLLCGCAAIGLSVWSFRVANQASVSLVQTRALLAVDTRGAAAGRLAADQLATQAQADATQMMAAQDAAERQAARAASYGFSGGYVQGPRPEGGDGSAGGSTSSYGQAGYGSMPYGSPSYGQAPVGAPQPGLAPPAASAGNVMGYTLPQTSPH